MLKAKVAAYTQAVDSSLTDANELIAYIARVSNPSNQHNNLSAPKLISYLQRHKHWSPFEHYSLTIEIECPKDIAVQLLRHRSFKFQEFSQRYADVTQLGFATRECRLQDTKNRQNSIDVDSKVWAERAIAEKWAEMQKQTVDMAKVTYQYALEMGIAKEQARALLPIGLTMSRLYMTGDIRSWLHYLAVRLDPTTQKEHRELAALIKDEVSKYFDLSAIFGDDNGQT
jgi:thymidylate synthase (FAD)